MAAKAGPTFTKDVVLVIVLFYIAAGTILAAQVGPWEAVRHAVLNGLIVLAWIGAAGRILGDTPIPAAEPIRRPVLELGWLLAIFPVIVALAANGYAGWIALPSWVYFAVFYGAVLVLFVSLRYPVKTLGLTWPTRSGWLALLAVILINAAAAILFQLIPQGESPATAPGDLAQAITGPWSIVVLMAGLLVRGALPEELFLRVALQPRLARFVPIGWAILLQAMLFMFGHLPQQMIRNDRSLLLALGYLLTIDNGLIGGYLWYRTRSLPLLLLVHLFAYPRFGI